MLNQQSNWLRKRGIKVAGDWIKFEVATSDKPEVWVIADVLQIDPDAVVGKLLRVWAWFDQHTVDGNAPSVTSVLLDRLVGVTGFCNAMEKAGWLERKGNAIGVTGFDKHNGESAKKRCQTAKRVAKHKNNAECNGDSVKKVTQTALPNALPREDRDLDFNHQQHSLDHHRGRARVVDMPVVERFAMNTDWNPSPEFSEQLAFTNLREGSRTDWQASLGEFVLYWCGRPEEQQTQSGWDHKFLQNLIANQVRAEALMR